MSVWALVPIKARAECKTRLAQALTKQQRLALVRAVLNHGLNTLKRVVEIDHLAVISPQRDGIDPSIELLADNGSGLNGSLLEGIEIARSRGATKVLIVPADLPQISEADVRAMLSAADSSGIAIAPDDRREGTNSLCINTALHLPLCFGLNSFQRHIEKAQALGVMPAIVNRPGLAFDLDTSTDLELLEQQTAKQLVVNDYTVALQ